MSDVAARAAQIELLLLDVDGVLTDGSIVYTDAGEELTDRELAQRTCAGCPVQDECLELELRTAGEDTTGVWGALTDDERRELYPHWLRRGDRFERGPRS